LVKSKVLCFGELLLRVVDEHQQRRHCMNTNNHKSGSDKIIHPVNVVGKSQASKPKARTPTTAKPFFFLPDPYWLSY